MSLNAGEVNPPNYERINDSTPPTIPMLAEPGPTYHHDVITSPTAYQGSSVTQTTVAPKWTVTTPGPPNVDSSSPFFKTFLKGEPTPLGIVVIVAAIIEIALGIALIFTGFSITVQSGIPFWGAIFYIIAGSLTIAAQRKPNVCLVRGSLALNIISTIVTTAAIIVNALNLSTVYDFISYRIHNHYNDNYNSNYNFNYNGYNIARDQSGKREEDRYNKPAAAFAILSFLLITNLLLFCVTLSTSIFGCRSLCKVQPQVSQMFFIQNDAVIPMNPGAAPTYSVQMPPPLQLYPANEGKAMGTNP